ncbi:MAG: DUF4129 domain-containing protein [Euryarchaeota archaeon]|nr:DUF4129 domain-containing protein [Euryarchaeota archaeon]
MKRALLVFVLVLLVLPAPTTGQASDDAVFAPVQTVVDAVPLVVDLAITESHRDATPDEAERLVAQMRTYVSGFEEDVEWPDGTVAAGVPLKAALLYTQDLAFLSALVPRRVALVERTQAACEAWKDTATRSDVLRWSNDTHPSIIELSATVSSLERLLARPPVPIDDTPLRNALVRLETWLDQEATETAMCLDELAARLAVELPKDLRLRVFPAESWPGARVRIIGGVLHARGGNITIDASTLGLDADLGVPARGAFLETIVVPLTTNLGPHEIRANYAGLTANATLLVDRIPVRLEVTAPSVVRTGTNVTLDVQVRPAVSSTLGSGDLFLSGAVNGTYRFSDHVLNLTVVAPLVPQVWNGTVRFNGTQLHTSAEADWSTTVEAPPAATPPPARARGGGNPIPFLYDTPVWVTIILGAIVLFAAWEGVVWLLAQSRRRSDRQALEQDAAGAAYLAEGEIGPSSPLRLSSLVALFVALHAWLLKRGVLHPSDTARDMGDYLRRWNPHIRRDVQAFEAVRYGGFRPPAKNGPVVRSMVAAWRKLTGKGE